ncbi:MAG: hypothetical protein J6J31_03680 [Thermoguttaceae bacterium]|nr:hypothetical protein [Thermoguttaceae bacterium]
MTDTKYEHIWNEFISTLNIKKRYRRFYVENEEDFVEFFHSKIPEEKINIARNNQALIFGKDKEFWQTLGEDGIRFWLWEKMASSLGRCSVPFVVKYSRDTFAGG